MRTNQSDYANQQALVAALLESFRNTDARQEVRLVETHISWVLLAGEHAWKIKKALNLGFLDFTRLDARRFYCEEEIRLNRRLAPDIYLDVVTIGGAVDAPEFGRQPALEYAVRMRRFDTSRELDHLQERGQLLPQHMDRLAAVLAAFHGNLPAVGAGSALGTPAAIRAASMQNFEQLLSLLTAHDERNAVTDLQAATAQAYAAGETYFMRRRAQGFVRECHGDLHLGNIVLVGEQPVPFDGIEFNPAFRWIDVMDEVAFLTMDLLYRNSPGMAFRFLNAWLEATGDYDGVAVLRFYLPYRATVRAKVSAIRASQSGQPQQMRQREQAECRGYLALAGACLSRRHPVLVITHGLPGSGKSLFAQAALERWQAIRIRSDVERKRLFGLGALDASRSAAGQGIYSAEATSRTYAHLLELARGLLAAGFPVIVDAAFLKLDERQQFRELARQLSVPFAVVDMQATPAALEARIVQRQRAASDASEADAGVLRLLQSAQQPLQQDELARTVKFLNDAEQGGIPADAPGWGRLEELLGRPGIT